MTHPAPRFNAMQPRDHPLSRCARYLGMDRNRFNAEVRPH